MNQKLSGMDAMFLNIDMPHAASHGTMIYIYDQTPLGDKPLGFREIVHHVESRLHVAPMMRRRIVQVPFGLGYPFWVEDDLFDIDFHVRHFALPKPGDWRQFCILLSRIHARAVDLSRAPWEMYVIEGLDNVEGIPKGSFAILTKIHHSAMDGTAAAELTWALHEAQESFGKRVPLAEAKEPPRSGRTSWTLADTLLHAWTDNTMAAANLALPLAKLVPHLTTTGLRKLMSLREGADLMAPRTRFNADVSASRVWNSLTVELDDVKRIKAAVQGATVNDAVIAIIGGAMRRYLDAKGELPDKSLVTMAPVNMRPGGVSETKASGNTISMMRFAMRTDIEAPIERLAAVHTATSESKEMQKAIGAQYLTDIQKFAPPATLGLAGRLSTALGSGGKGSILLHNCGVTNIPGPNTPLYMKGARLVYWCGAGPVTDGMSLIWNPSSYCGKMFISMTSAPNIVPDPDFLLQCLKESFEEMKQAAAQAGVAAPAAPAREVVAKKSAVRKPVARKPAAKKAKAL